MNLKKLSKINDSSKQDKIRELISNAGFTYNAETETVTSDIEDYEEADEQAWDLYGSIEELLVGDEVDALGEPDGGEFFLDKHLWQESPCQF